MRTSSPSWKRARQAVWRACFPPAVIRTFRESQGQLQPSVELRDGEPQLRIPIVSVYFVKFSRIAATAASLTNSGCGSPARPGRGRRRPPRARGGPPRPGGPRASPTPGSRPPAPRSGTPSDLRPGGDDLGGVSPSNFRKFSMKRAASCLYFFTYSALSCHASAGRRTWSGTLDTFSGRRSRTRVGLVLHVLQLPVQRGVQEVARVPDADPLSDAVGPAHPAGVHEPAVDAVSLDLPLRSFA